jgi:hypothetical protein
MLLLLRRVGCCGVTVTLMVGPVMVGLPMLVDVVEVLVEEWV